MLRFFLGKNHLFGVSNQNLRNGCSQKIMPVLNFAIMQNYDPTKPLIFSHIPKTAGTSIQALFKGWFGDNFLPHYNHAGWSEKRNLDDPVNPNQPVAVYGHFNRARGQAIDHCYPKVDQFITILRDPWERVLSGYFYRTRSPANRIQFPKVAAMGIEEYMEGWPFDDPTFGPPSHNFLPRTCNSNNFKDVLKTGFLEIGFAEDLAHSVTRIAKTLGTEFDPDQLPHVNAAPRPYPTPEHLKPAFIVRNSLEYAIYDYAKEQYGRP